MRVEQYGECDPQVIDKGADATNGFLNIYTQYEKLAISVRRVSFLDRRHLIAAVAAPGRPEIEHDSLPLEVTQSNGVTL